MNVLTKYVLATTAGALLATGANAATFDVTAEVSSTISLTETTQLTLGTLYVSRPTTAGGTEATVTINAQTGAISTVAAGTAAADGRIIPLGGHSAGELTITGAASFTEIDVDLTAPTVDLSHESGNGALPTLDFTTLTASTADDLPAGATVTTDGNGDATISVGGTFTVAGYVNGEPAYAEGIYTGEYTITVSY